MHAFFFGYPYSQVSFPGRTHDTPETQLMFHSWVVLPVLTLKTTTAASPGDKQLKLYRKTPELIIIKAITHRPIC